MVYRCGLSPDCLSVLETEVVSLLSTLLGPRSPLVRGTAAGPRAVQSRAFGPWGDGVLRESRRGPQHPRSGGTASKRKGPRSPWKARPGAAGSGQYLKQTILSTENFKASSGPHPSCQAGLLNEGKAPRGGRWVFAGLLPGAVRPFPVCRAGGSANHCPSLPCGLSDGSFQLQTAQ